MLEYQYHIPAVHIFTYLRLNYASTAQGIASDRLQINPLPPKGLDIILKRGNNIGHWSKCHILCNVCPFKSMPWLLLVAMIVREVNKLAEKRGQVYGSYRASPMMQVSSRTTPEMPLSSLGNKRFNRICESTENNHWNKCWFLADCCKKHKALFNQWFHVLTWGYQRVKRSVWLIQ